MQTHHQSLGKQVNIGIRGLRESVTVLHVTDSHISCDRETDCPFDDYSARMHDAYGQFDRPGAFRRAMDLAVEKQVDLVALTGDQINYPSVSAVEFVKGEIRRTGIRHVYTSGNHDWHYEGMPGSSRDLQHEWREKRLKPLYADSQALSCSSMDIGGLRFVMIENGTYQVDEVQLAFFETQLSAGLPTVLLVHIPLCVSGLLGRSDGSPVCGDPSWGALTDRNYVVERRERWPVSGNLPSTMAFVAAVKQAENLVAVFCGHIHQHREDVIHDQAVQYVTEPGFRDGYRLVRFVGL